MLRLDIRGVNACPLEKEVLTEGRVGLEISFTFSSDWDGLTKIAVFEGAQTIDVILVNDRCVVPHEALAQSGAALRIGVYGQNSAGDIVIPTVWAKFGMVQPAAVPSEVSSKPPTPSVVAQILSAAQSAESSASEAERIAQSVRDDADAGKFDGKDGVDGSTIWTTTVAPAEPMGGGYEFMVSDLTGVSGGTPAVGDLIFYDSAYYPITSVTGHTIVDRKAIADLKVDIRGADGQDGLDGSAIWKSSAPPTVLQPGGFTVILFNLSDLSGPDGHTIQSGDLIFYDSDYYTVGRVSDTTCTALGKTSIKGDTGPQGPQGETGPQGPKGDKGDSGLVDTELKLTLLNLAKKVTWIDNRGERYYQDLWNALYGDDYQENFTRVGTPTIENGILTASADGYVTTPESFNPGSSPWELTVKLYRPRLAAKYERFFTSGGVQVITAYNSASSNLYLYSDNGAISEAQVYKSIPAEQWVWIKVAFSGSIYDFGKSTDGFTYTYLAGGHTPFTGYIPSNLNTSTPIKAGVLSFLSSTGNYASVAKIDLKETEIKVNGEVWWKPYILE